MVLVMVEDHSYSVLQESCLYSCHVSIKEESCLYSAAANVIHIHVNGCGAWQGSGRSEGDWAEEDKGNRGGDEGGEVQRKLRGAYDIRGGARTARAGVRLERVKLHSHGAVRLESPIPLQPLVLILKCQVYSEGR